MFGKVIISALVLFSSVVAGENKTEEYKQFEGVDPNTLSCDPDGHIFLLLPHFTDCAKFYMCAHGEEVEFNCAPGTVFDFPQQVCNHPWATQCWLRTLPDEEGSGDEMIGLFIDHIEEQPVDIVASVRPISPLLLRYSSILNCNRADEAARQVAHKGDCQRYWRCISGAPQVAYCSDGLFFNEQTQQCDYEANVKCTSLPDEELGEEFIVYK